MAMTQAPLGTGPREEPTAFTAWRALGMLIQLVVTDPGQLDAARDLLDRGPHRARPDVQQVP